MITNFLKHIIGRRIIIVCDRIKNIYNAQRKKKIIENYKDSPKYLNVGGARFTRKNWRVLDYITPHYNFNPIFVDFNINLESCEKWPIETESYDLIYVSHTLEHLSQKAVKRTLEEMSRILKKGGGVRITGPDIDLFLSHYEIGDWKWFDMLYPERSLKRIFPNLKERTLEDLLLWSFASHLIGKISPQEIRRDFNSMDKTSFLDRYRNLIQDDWQKKNPGFHRNWLNFKKLERLLREKGFSQIVRNGYKQSVFAEMCSKEFDTTAPESTLFVDALK